MMNSASYCDTSKIVSDAGQTKFVDATGVTKIEIQRINKEDTIVRVLNIYLL